MKTEKYEARILELETIIATYEAAQMIGNKKQQKYTNQDMLKAYEYGQEDCGEFGIVLGFEQWINNYKP